MRLGCLMSRVNGAISPDVPPGPRCADGAIRACIPSAPYLVLPSAALNSWQLVTGDR